MKIGIDISQIAYEGTGTAKYFENLISWLPKIASQNEYHFFAASLRRQNRLRSYAKTVWPLPPTLLDLLWNRLHVFPVENFVGPVDVFHSSDWTQPPSKAKKIAPILDMVVYKFPQSSHPQIIATQKRRLAWVKKEADKIITISQSAKKDIVEILEIPEEKINVVYLAAGNEFVPSGPKFSHPKPYILAVGTREPRKNLDRLVAAFTQLNIKNLDLIIAGKFGWGDENPNFAKRGISAEGTKLNIKNQNNIKTLGYVPQEEMPALYRGAACFVYPSLYEGFGVPVLEAMASGCPVITSSTGSLPEVGGTAAVYVGPTKTNEIAGAIDAMLRLNSSTRQNLVKRGSAQAAKFSWEKTARETAKVYEELVQR